MVCELAVIADDLTGANDTGVQFGKHGLKTIVVVDLTKLRQLRDNVDVIVVNTDTRHLSPSAAYDRVRTVVERLLEERPLRVYKKIDSTLRGNIGAELDAVMDATHAKAALIMPAFPAYGRTTVDGYQLWNGSPIIATEVGRDPLSPVTEAHVPTLLSRQSRRSVFHIPLATVRAGEETLTRALKQAISEGKQLIVADATVRQDLALAARVAAGETSLGVMCGSAGLAQELPGALRLLKRVEQCQPGAGERILVVAASLSRVTREQLDALKTEPLLRFVSASVPRLLGSTAGSNFETGRIMAEVLTAFGSGFDVAIALTDEAESARSSQSAVKSQEIVMKLAEVVQGVLAKTPTCGLVLTGGDTAMAICRVLGAAGVEVRDEVATGIPFGTLIGGRWDGMDVVTKAGAFGERNALVKSVHYLRTRRNSRGVEQLKNSGVTG